MARTVRDVALSTRSARERLEHSGKPYFRSIDNGLHIGYRKGKTGGRWVVRWYKGKQDYRVETIGTADDVIDADGVQILNFSQAQAHARDLFVKRRYELNGVSAPRSGPYTVKDCLDDYVEWMGEKRKSSADARYRANGIIIPDLGDIDCEKLTADRIKRWLHAAAKKPPRLRSKNGEPQKYRVLHNDDESKRRRQATLNRTLTVLKAALNRAWRDKKISSDSEWRRVEPFEAVDGARPRYLKVEEAKRLLNASPLAFRRLVQAALATGARYGELAVLNVNDFNSDSDTLHIRTSKSGKGRHVYLTTEGVSLFGALTAGRSADEPLLVKDDGSRWATSHQIRPMKEACAAAKVKGATFHCLRHTYASLAIMNDAPLFVVAKNLGHADTRMVEKHYGHLASSYMADAIRAGAPRFGFKLDKKVVELRPGK